MHFISNPIKFSRFSFKQLWVNNQQARFAEGLTLVSQEWRETCEQWKGFLKIPLIKCGVWSPFDNHGQSFFPSIYGPNASKQPVTVVKFYRRLYHLPPKHTNVRNVRKKIGRLWWAKSLSILASLLKLRRYFRRCWQTFAKWSSSNLGKNPWKGLLFWIGNLSFHRCRVKIKIIKKSMLKNI